MTLDIAALTPDRWHRIDTIVDRVLDADPSERAQVIGDACGDDAALRAEVESFIASCDEAATMFESAPILLAHEAFALADDRHDRDALEPGDMVGTYRIVEPLGAGGMGAVYLAERADGAFDKRVALKVIKRGLDTDEIVRRFRNERQIVARLEHPNIAALLDGGATATGLPYFAMELAPGMPIDEYCDTNQLGLADRLQLFLTVCDAVRYAHRNLVVHRDLKPSNILVADGEPKLLDFGIAKVLDPETGTSETATRLPERRLTPEYAAPEQVLGLATTTATDVYALGVILYELISGVPPYRFESRSLIELEHVICNVDPRPPSETIDALNAALIPADLDAIVLKALHKEPERRYGGAVELADDLERYLEGRPVLARPDTGIYRLQKFVRRNFAIVGLSAAAALTLVAGTIMTGWMAVRAARESTQRELEAQRVEFSRDFLVDMLSRLNPDLLGGQREFTYADIISLGLAHLMSMEKRDNLQSHSDLPEAERAAARATVTNTLAKVVFNLGDHARADSLYRAALALLESYGDYPERAVSLMGRGEVLRRAGQFSEAQALFADALAMRRQLRVDSLLIAESLISLAATHYNLGTQAPPDSAESLFALAAAGLRDAFVMPNLSEELRAQALEGLADIAAGRADNTAGGQDESRALSGGLPEVSQNQRKLLEEAQGFYAAALEEGAKAAHPSPAEEARRRWGLALVFKKLGLHEDAVAENTRALEMLRQTYHEAHQYVASALYRLGSSQYAAAQAAKGQTDGLTRFSDAAETLQAAARAYEGLGDALWTGHSLQYRGRALLEGGDPAGASRVLNAALATYMRLPEDTARDGSIARTNRWLGDAYIANGQLARAARAYTEAWAVFVEPLDRREVADSIAEDIADVYNALGLSDSASVYRWRRGSNGSQDHPPRL